MRKLRIIAFNIPKGMTSFSSVFPLLRLDRIYVRGFHVQHAKVHSSAVFSCVSCHATLSVTLLPL
ncbi:MAG: hypothetical protein LBE24_10155 [Methylobacillus sp.]|jgi:endonuclease/exonuclease/phosphatase family metal-dependent hydrolase|nr:hypothetical protein [Methylobacillus sp.]